ncbi:MAG: hypothetical protein K9J16_06100 [Melioribacteraceae bacterium]|nr:hypothetical protein [Melioribacteraceae bacterium]MCF8354175.1 hypothetical protein [Melioribacteraceae bacterium]MCF8394713.1 hypothetical protein [Melioribacteraceae bacterium]MCF8418098.1 hypothetical protein [Melioribacteraceae bacterium]
MNTAKIVLPFIIIVLGVFSSNLGQKILADPIAHCCERGLCNEQPCSSASSAFIWTQIEPFEKYCVERLITCGECMNLKYSPEWHCDEFTTLPTYCIDENGDPYYGTHQNFGPPLPTGESIGN